MYPNSFVFACYVASLAWPDSFFFFFRVFGGVIQLGVPRGDSSEVNSYWSCTRPFSPPNTVADLGFLKRSGYSHGHVLIAPCYSHGSHVMLLFYG